MKNKRWKRKAKRLKGKADPMGECFFCKLGAPECEGACSVGIKELENSLKNEGEQRLY